MKTIYTYTVATFISILFTGCVCVTKQALPAGPPEASRDPANLPARGGSVDWGLALSGGGIRSGAFSIGVMKTLYDKGLLDQIDVISAVSGGGYAAHWLYSQYELGHDQRFGASVYASNEWARAECLLQLQASFVPNGRALRHLPWPPVTAARMYEQSIVRFGNTAVHRTSNLGAARNKTFQSVGSLIGSNAAPYLILEATLETEKRENVCKDREHGPERIFELTPDYRGNRTFGYYPWNNDSIRFGQASAISGAAVRVKLAQHIDNPFPGASKKLTLWDGGGGGKTENLGAYALIIRGIHNVIIVDAEQDANYVFEAYTNLQKHLAEDDIKFEVPEVEEFCRNRCINPGAEFSKAIALGLASRPASSGKPEISTRIYYIKMCRPDSLFTDYTEGGETKVKVRNADYCALKERDLRVREGRYLMPNRVKYLADFPLTPGLFAAAVENYCNYLDTSVWARLKGKARYSFPHIPTSDQSFYNDQMEALIGLGYLQTLELNPEVSPNR